MNGQKSGEPNKAYASSFSYAAHSAISSVTLGNNLIEKTTFNNRLQPTFIKLGTTANPASVVQLGYTYGVLVGGTLDTTKNNGNIQSETVAVGASAIRQSFLYDSLNRLQSAAEDFNQAAKWTQIYTYDRCANRTSLSNSGVDATLLPTSGTPSVDTATNRINQSGFVYDAVGNLKQEPGKSYDYDAENRQVKFNNGAVTYSYDGDGLRVRKVVNGVTTFFVYDAFQHLIAEYTTPDQQPQGGGGTSFLTSDHLGSTRVVTDANGNLKSRHDYMPFGEELGTGIGSRTAAMKYGANDGLKQKFTGKQRDTETLLDYFGARYYSSSHARFTGVDPLMESAHPALPQTWNRFAYVLNNPLVIIDPNGEGWLLVFGHLYWDPNVNSEKDARKKGGEYLPPGTILTITRATGPWSGLTGHNVILGTAGVAIDVGKPRPIPIKEIEFYGGDGERFLLAYFKFALENAVLGFVGAKAVDAVEALYQLAKAKRAGQAAIDLLEKAKGVCFAAGTQVTTRGGDKPIEDLKEGDEVLSSEPECGEKAWQRVTRVYERSASELLDIVVEGVKIGCTPEHPFWVDGAGWIAAGELKPGTRLLRSDGQTVRVESIRHREGSFTVYNVEVERLHSYYVSSLGILVHNQCQAGKVGEETLSRLGTSTESAARLGRKAAEAEEKIGIHGVSATAGTPTGEASSASRSSLEEFFKVHNTGTRSDPLHRTIELPKPVTNPIAERFNRIFGRD